MAYRRNLNLHCSSLVDTIFFSKLLAGILTYAEGMKQKLTIVVVVVLFVLGAAAGQDDDPVSSKLRVITASTTRVEAEFYTPTDGIHILSEVRNNGETVRILITTTGGESLFAVDRPLYSFGLVSIVGNEFLFVNETSDNGETKMTDYLVPLGYSQKVMRAIKRDRLSKILRYLNRETVNATATSAFEELIARPEVLLIKEAAFALGNTGLKGVNNPAAMAFYSTAIHLANELTVDDDDREDEISDELPFAIRGRRSTRYCTNSRSNCIKCPRGRKCLGLCGPGCRCWEFVCDDCCYNIGCYLHDKYACAFGRLFPSCWAFWYIGLVCTRGL